MEMLKISTGEVGADEGTTAGRRRVLPNRWVIAPEQTLPRQQSGLQSPSGVVSGRSVGLEPLPASPIADLVTVSIPSFAWVVGRLLFAIALAGLAQTARQAMRYGDAMQRDWYRGQLGLLGAIVVLGAVAVAWWAATLTANARRLRLRTMHPVSIAATWLLPLVWVAIASAGLLRIEVDAEIDPMPGIAAAGFALAMAVPYLATASVLRSFSRRSMTGWWSALYVIDVVCFGLGWNLLSGRPPVDGVARFGDLGVEAVALAALGLVAAAMIAVLIAARTPGLIRDRVAVLESRNPGSRSQEPDWFRTGLAIPADRAATAARARRTLLRTTMWRQLAAAIPFGGGVGVVLVGVVGISLSVRGTPLADELVYRLALVTCMLTLAHLAVHGIWATLASINAGRSSIRGAVPRASLLLCLPVPMTAIGAMIATDDILWSTAFVGLVVALATYVGSIWMLGTVHANMQGRLGPFRAWLLVSLLVAVTGLCALLTVVPQPLGRTIGVAPLLMATTWGLVLMIGALPARSAMRTFDENVLAFRQAERRPAADIVRIRRRSADTRFKIERSR